MKKQNNRLMPMDDGPMTKEQVLKTLERLESQRTDEGPFRKKKEKDV